MTVSNSKDILYTARGPVINILSYLTPEEMQNFCKIDKKMYAIVKMILPFVVFSQTYMCKTLMPKRLYLWDQMAQLIHVNPDHSQVAFRIEKFVSGRSNSLETETCLDILRLAPRLLHIDLTGSSSALNGSTVARLPQICPQTKIYTFSKMAHLNDNDVIQFVNSCPNMERLELEGSVISDAVLIALSLNCHSLKQLNLKYCRSITDQGIDHIIRGCINLEGLSLDNTGISDTGLESFAAHGKNIRYLSLANQDINYEGLQSLSEGCPNLTNLNLKWCRGVTDRGIGQIVRACSRLQSLFLDGTNVSNTGLASIAAHGKNLWFLSLASAQGIITDEGLQALSEGCPNLGHLNLQGVKNISAKGLKLILQNSKKLYNLNLSKVSLTQNDLTALIPFFRNLRALDISEIDINLDEAAGLIAQHCKNLRTFNAEKCLLTDLGLRSLEPLARKLSRVNLSSTNVGDQGLSAFLGKTSNLIELRLGWCSNLTPNCLESLANANLNCLEILDLGSIEIGDAGLLDIVARAPNLEELYIPSCGLVQKRETCNRVQQMCPKLRSLDRG